jgi:hypothetical protein
MYKIIYYPQTTDILNIIRLSDNSRIPVYESNFDYQEYLKWVAEGNVAEEYIPEEV